MKREIKKLPKSVVEDIVNKNAARKALGLSPIKIKARPCQQCGDLFETTGNRTCGCFIERTEHGIKKLETDKLFDKKGTSKRAKD